MTLTNYFSNLDYAFMGFYVIVLIGLSFYLKRLASRSLDNYICGAQNIPWWAMGISGMASFLDMAGTAIIVSFLFLLGPQGLFVEFRGGAVLVLVFMMLWTGKWHRRSGCLTGAQWNIYRFGDCWGGRASQLMGVIATVLTSIGMLAYIIIGAGIFLSTFLDFSPLQCSIGLMSLAALYTMLAGFYGVIYTDLFQTCIILAAVVYISIKAFGSVESVEELGQVAMNVTNNPDWVSGVPKWEAYMPAGYEEFNLLIWVATIYLIRNIIAGIGTGADPRYFGAKSDKECAKLSMLWTFLMAFRWPMMIGIAVLGLYLVQEVVPDQSKLKEANVLILEANPDTDKTEWADLIHRLSYEPKPEDAALVAQTKVLLGEDKWIEKMNLMSYEGTVNPEKILSQVLLMSVGPGMRGILVIALIAAALSTFGSWVNLATGQFVNDFYKKWIRPEAQTRELIFASWGTVIGLVILSFLFSRTLESINDIWEWLMMGFGAGFLVPSFLRLYWWRFNGSGSAIGTLFGLTAAIIQRAVYPELTGNWQFVFVMCMGFLGSVVATLLTKPTDMDVLKKMYMETRPFGFWGPLKAQLTEEEKAKMAREHRSDILGVPFALIWQTTLFLAPMLLILHNWTGFIGATALGIGSFAALYFVWYRHQPEGNYYSDEEVKVKESA